MSSAFGSFYLLSMTQEIILSMRARPAKTSLE